MNPLDNPFAPGAGTPPPELAGRDALLGSIHVAAERTRRLLAARSVLLLGLRGVGKTVVLDRVHDRTQADGFATIMIEATERSALPALLAAELHRVLLRLSARNGYATWCRAPCGYLLGSCRHSTGVRRYRARNRRPRRTGGGRQRDLELDLVALFEAVGATASASDTALIVLIDELQHVPKAELAALCAALHRAAQRRLPILLAAAGLPALRAQVAEAKTYASACSSFTRSDRSTRKRPVTRSPNPYPYRARDADITSDALKMVIDETHGYPYFLQEWGKHAWDLAESSPIDAGDVARASDEVAASLDAGFFRARFDRLTPAEKRYLRAMAELGPGPHRSGGDRPGSRPEGDFPRAYPRSVDCEGHDLECGPRRYGLHGSLVRPFHAPHHARPRLAGVARTGPDGADSGRHRERQAPRGAPRSGQPANISSRRRCISS